MTIQDAIDQLQKIKDEHGNLPFLITKTICDWEYRLYGFKVEKRGDSYNQGYWSTEGDKAVEGEFDT